MRFGRRGSYPRNFLEALAHPTGRQQSGEFKDKDRLTGRSSVKDSRGVPTLMANRLQASSGRQIVISSSPFGRRVEVEVQPPRVDHPVQRFRTPSEAEEFADRLAELTGWPVRDDREGAGGN